MSEDTSSLETRSRATCSSVRSNASSTQSAAARARAKAEAAKARLAYAEEEINLKLEKAKLKASIKMLNYKKETAAAIAEAEALEAAVDINCEKKSCDLILDSGPLETVKRTEQYVIEQTNMLKEKAQACTDDDAAKSEPGPSHSISPSHLKPEARPFIPDQVKTASRPFPLSSQQPDTYDDVPHEVKFENDYATGTQYSRPQNNPIPQSHRTSINNDSSNINDFVRFLARRELVSTGLLQFNDKAQNYRAWKRSFLSAISGLNLSASEEMDLLLKWLGKESAQHVEQLRAIHINYPEAGLAMIWDRLEQTYGSTEAIEDALFKRIDDFPKITNRDFSKLVQLGDLLMELQSAKSEGDLPGLSFLDTARGVNPIVQKLPFRLQERWASVGASYKQRRHVPYPPFFYFVDFVCQEARIASDPSFNFTTHTDVVSRTEKTAWKSNKFSEISVHKTEILPKAISSTGETPIGSDDFNKICPLHKKPHPLNRCRTFRERPIGDRMAFLRENEVCFKCCTSSSHIARNCNVKVQCAECGSEKHHTALHPGPSPWKGEVDPFPEHGGEEEETASQPRVTTKCTEICGGELMNRSCSKICLVNVYPAGHRDKAVKLYAIIDEQSNRSLVRSQFFDVFSDQSPSAPYTLRTCAGVKEVSGRKTSGYEVESLDGNVRIPLPSLIECNDIPNNRDEIPTPEVAIYHPHLQSVAHLIPKINPQAEIMLLLGRDLIRVHKVRKQVNGPHNLPYAQKLDLGWVIVGNACLGKTHKRPTINTFYTRTSELTHPTPFDPCPNMFGAKEKYSNVHITTYPLTCPEEKLDCDADHLGCAAFAQTKEDNQVAALIPDAYFMRIMKDGLQKDSSNNRVLRIQRSSHPDQWCYVPIDKNPADHATCTVAAGHLKDTNWLTGTKLLSIQEPSIFENNYNLVDPSSDPDIGPLMSTPRTTTSSKQLGSKRFAKSSIWRSPTHAIARLLHRTLKGMGPCKGWYHCKTISLKETTQASAVFIRTVQEEVCLQEIKCIKKQEKLPRSSPLHSLDLYIDNTTVKTYLPDQGFTCTFNPPRASQHGGICERMIGLARRILDSMFLQLKDKLAYEVLVTFITEVAAIINGRPLVPVTTDPDDLYLLTPAALLTQKVNIVPAPAGVFGVSDLYKSQRQKVQNFWDRWRKQFLPASYSLTREGSPFNQKHPTGKCCQVGVKIAKPGGTFS